MHIPSTQIQYNGRLYILLRVLYNNIFKKKIKINSYPYLHRIILL